MPTAQKWENVEWYSVMSWHVTGPNTEAVMTIFFDHLMPVSAEVWPEMTCLRLITGDERITCFGPMSGGLADLEWKVSPEFTRFLSLLVEREGEAGTEMLGTFYSGVADFTSHIALKHTGGM
jgi:hypothetical protein